MSYDPPLGFVPFDLRVPCECCGFDHPAIECPISHFALKAKRRRQYTEFVKQALEKAEVTVEIQHGISTIRFTLGEHTHRWDTE